MDATIGTSDTQELIEKGIDWGAAKISSPDKSIDPEIIVAKKQNDDYSLPNIILGVGNYVNRAGETLLTLPAGEWDITPRDKFGASNAEPAVTITAQEETDVICEENDDTADSTDVALQYCNYVVISISTGTRGFTVDNSVDSTYAIKWIGKSFSATFIKYYEATDYKYTITIDGNVSLASYDNLEVSMSATEIYQHYNDDNILKTQRTTEINAITVPLTRTKNDSYGEPWLYFEINSQYNSELLSALTSYASYSYHGINYNYSTDGSIRSETLYDTIDDPTNGYIQVRLGYSKYKVLTDY
ncbi:MAG: hypothetical protein U9Q91_07565 [Candidatus Marinimicrobia bacterium]|nr:hypothetical protein [Candidatus Neomarinimicrobiota bacterium]